MTTGGPRRRLTFESWERNVWALALVVFIAFVGFQFFSPFLPLYVMELGVTDPTRVALWSGALTAVTPAVSGLLGPLWGGFADRVGRKMMMIRSLAGFVLIVAAMGLVTSVTQLLALRGSGGAFPRTRRRDPRRLPARLIPPGQRRACNVGMRLLLSARR